MRETSAVFAEKESFKSAEAVQLSVELWLKKAGDSVTSPLPFEPTRLTERPFFATTCGGFASKTWRFMVKLA